MRILPHLTRALLVSGVLALSLGCQRSPEDLEIWKTSEGGEEKLMEWAASGEESMPVRQRALQLLLEMREVNQVGQLLEKEHDEAVRAQLVEGAFVTVQEFWSKQDQPSEAALKEQAGETGQVAVGDSLTVVGKDAAYFLQPFAQGATKEKLESMLAEWVSTEQDLRDQLGNVKIGQIFPRAGEAALESAAKWLETTSRPSSALFQLKEHYKEEEERDVLAEALVKRAEADLTKVEGELVAALRTVESDKVVPLMKKMIAAEGTDPAIADGFMASVVKLQGEKSTSFFSDLVANRKGAMRWVAAQNLIDIRGKAGILAAANSLPLELEAYEGEELAKEMTFVCNSISTAMAEKGTKDLTPEVKQLLQSKRWPVQAMGLKCAEVMKTTGAKAEVEALKKSKTKVPAWNGETTKMGTIAGQTLSTL